MDEGRDFTERMAEIRALLRERLGEDPGNSEKFGNGRFTFGMKYGEQGTKGDMVWTVTRYDDALRRRRDLTFEWRAFTAQSVADELVKAYEQLELS